LNAAYLAAFATPSLFYFSNVALHPVLGVLVAGLAIRQFWPDRGRRPSWSWGVRLGVSVGVVGVLAEAAILVMGGTNQ